ncbi:MAG: hypothetical protein GWO26_00910, partial [Phycisphaerae bacterium]|nr:hypothetical protein [Phycisphaerae bacterium]
MEFMIRRVYFIIICSAFIVLTACIGNEGESTPTNLPVETTVPTIVKEVAGGGTDEPTIVIEPTVTAVEPTDIPTNVPIPTNTAATNTRDLSLADSGVTLLPVPKIYEGDLVTFKIAPFLPEGVGINDVRVQIFVDNRQILKEILNWRSLGGDTYGLYEWVWNTSGQAGQHTITVTVDPDDQIQVGDEDQNNNQVVMNVTVHPRTDLDPLDAESAWVTESNGCCTLHVVSGTTAYRDLGQLLELTDAAFLEAAEQLTEPLDQQYDVYFIDRVLGQGGYATGAMVVSYLDRN